jgi:hypothetical protein
MDLPYLFAGLLPTTDSAADSFTMESMSFQWAPALAQVVASWLQSHQAALELVE